MKRRKFITLLGGGAATWPLAAWAQQAPNPQQEKSYRVGFLFAGTIALRPQAQEFWKALHELGYVEGKNLIVEIREARGQLDRLPKLASELREASNEIERLRAETRVLFWLIIAMNTAVVIIFILAYQYF